MIQLTVQEMGYGTVMRFFKIQMVMEYGITMNLYMHYLKHQIRLLLIMIQMVTVLLMNWMGLLKLLQR